ncbi:MAG: TolC family outer membrane protein [Gammaproteobacteria bacterium]|nr:TolC family outer membrane protein [Gammaproteobacteria bacterium]
MKNLFKKNIFIISGLLLCISVASAQTLQQAVTQTTQTNPDVLIKMKGWLAAQKGITAAQGGYLPSVDFNGDVGVEHINDPTEPDYNTLNPAGVGLSVRQMLFDGFATPSEVQRNKKLTEADKYSLSGTANDTALLAAQSYLDVMRTQKIVDLAQQNYRTHQRLYRMIRSRSKSGLGRKADTSQAYGRLARARANLMATQNNYSDATAIYFKVVGVMPSNLQAPVSPKTADLPTTQDIAIQSAIDNHPFLKAAKSDIEEAEAQNRAAKSTYYPHLDAVLGTNSGSDIMGDEGHYDDYRAMLRLKYNLFHGGSDKAHIDQTGILVQQAEQVQHRTYDQVVEHMKLAWNGLQTAQNQLNSLKIHRNSSIATVRAYYKQFKIGKRTLLDLLNSEDELFTSKVAYLNGQNDLLLAKYQVLNAQGKLLAYLQVPDPSVAQQNQQTTPTTAVAATQAKAATPSKPGVVVTPAAAKATTGGAAGTPPQTNSNSGYKVTNKHISPQINKGYTLQLYNSYNKDEAVNFIVKNKLQNKAAFYKTTFMNKDKYVVIYGAYKTPKQALDAIRTMPAGIQKWNPVVKPLAKVQQEMKS